MKKNSKHSSQSLPSGEENLENYYDLKTDAIEALASADTEEAPEYSKEELEKYRTQSPIRIPEVLKVCFLKWWFAGAMFYFCGFGLGLGHWLDRWIVYSIVLGMVTDLLTNNLLRFLEKLEDPKQVVNILRSYLSAPERVMRITACCNDYSQAMLELNAIPTGEPDSKQDIPVCRTDLSRYDRLLGRRDAV